MHNRSKNSAVALQFVNWFLSDQIQQLIPDHEWMFPARSNVALPPCFKGYPCRNGGEGEGRERGGRGEGEGRERGGRGEGEG